MRCRLAHAVHIKVTFQRIEYEDDYLPCRKNKYLEKRAAILKRKYFTVEVHFIQFYRGVNDAAMHSRLWGVCML